MRAAPYIMTTTMELTYVYLAPSVNLDTLLKTDTRSAQKVPKCNHQNFVQGWDTVILPMATLISMVKHILVKTATMNKYA